MSSLGTSKGVLEIAKFGIYVSVPIVLMYAFANNTKNLQKFMGNVSPFFLSLTECFWLFFPVYGSEFVSLWESSRGFIGTISCVVGIEKFFNFIIIKSLYGRWYCLCFRINNFCFKFCKNLISYMLGTGKFPKKYPWTAREKRKEREEESSNRNKLKCIVISFMESRLIKGMFEAPLNLHGWENFTRKHVLSE